MPNSALPPHLRRPHNDWPFPFSKIPRGLTAWDWGRPKKILGNQEVSGTAWKFMKPIGPAGTWQFSYFPAAPWWAKPFAFYLAISFKPRADGWFRHVRIGARYDDVDDYTQWPSIAARRFPAVGDRNTEA